MKALPWILGVIIILSIGFVSVTSSTATKQSDTAMNSQLPTITPIMHATAIITWGDITILTDPTDAKLLSGQKAADIVLVTDIHGDHLSTSTLAAIVGPSTTLIVPKAVHDLLPPDLAARAKVLANGETFAIHELKIVAEPMYNLPTAENKNFHTKGRGNGYIIGGPNARVYVAGDTAGTPEMRALKNIDIALVPMNLPYTMGIDEAADAVLAFKPKHVYPYHYRGQDGLADIEKFKSLVNAGDPDIDVQLLNWYPQQ